MFRNRYTAVASLWWVTPGAATEGVTPPFFPQKPDDLFLLIAVIITIAFYYFHSGVTPLSRVSSHTFLRIRPRFSTIFFVNLPTIFFLRVSPPWRVSPGAVRPQPPLVTPLAIRTDSPPPTCRKISVYRYFICQYILRHVSRGLTARRAVVTVGSNT